MDFGAAMVAVVNDGQWGSRQASLVFLPVRFATAVNSQPQVRGQGINHRHAHPVQSAGYLVGVLIELSTCVQLGHNDLGR